MTECVCGASLGGAECAIRAHLRGPRLAENTEKTGDEGKLVSGFQGRLCAADHCRTPLTDQTGAYLHTDRESGKLVIFCEACSLEVRLHHSLRLPLVAL